MLEINIRNQLPIEVLFQTIFGPISKLDYALPTGKIDQKIANVQHELEAMLTHVAIVLFIKQLAIATVYVTLGSLLKTLQ